MQNSQSWYQQCMTQSLYHYQEDAALDPHTVDDFGWYVHAELFHVNVTRYKTWEHDHHFAL
jgi:hypothetical protein